MDRRQFVKTGVAATVAATLPHTAHATTAARGPATSSPNILYVFADQHRAASLNLANTTDPNFRTPNLYSMNQKGMNFSNCISNYPLCSPYRGILMTGLYPCDNGVTSNSLYNESTEGYTPSSFSLNSKTVTQVFKSAGYTVGYVGKWDLNGDPGSYSSAEATAYDIDDWNIWYNTDNHYCAASPTKKNSAYYYPKGKPNIATFTYGDTSKTNWNPNYQTQQAAALITKYQAARAANSSAAWVLFVSYNVPHPPYQTPNTVDGSFTDTTSPAYRANVSVNTTTGEVNPPSATFLGQDAALSVPASGTGANPNGNVTDPAQNGAHSASTTTALTNDLSNYQQGITNIDTEFGTLWSLVENDPNTIVIYTADHGDMMASHSLTEKVFPFEESINVPWFISGSYNNGTTIPANVTNTQLFGTIDIVPTLCGLAGITNLPSWASNWAGLDFSPVMLGYQSQLSPGHDHIVIMGGPGNPAQGDGNSSEAPTGIYACPTYRGVRTSTYTYAVLSDHNGTAYSKGANVGPYNSGHWLLFNNSTDTYQQTNLIQNGEFPCNANFSTFSAQLTTYLSNHPNDTFTSSVLANEGTCHN